MYNEAFDRVEYVKLFTLLVHGDILSVSFRLLLNMFTGHVTRIAWNGVCFESLSVINGVKQSGVMILVIFCIYLDGLLCRLAKTTIGSYIGNMFVCALAYADNIALLAHIAEAMRLMLGIL